MEIRRITAKLALAAQTAIKANRYRFYSYCLVSFGLICLVFRITQSFHRDNVSLFALVAGIMSVWFGWMCKRVSESYLEDFRKYKM